MKFKHFDWYLILALSLFLAVMYVTFSLPNVEAISRAEYDELKDKVDSSEIDIETKTENISEKNTEIKNQQKIIDDLKNDIRELKRDSSGSFQEYLEITEIEDLLSAANDSYNTFRDELKTLLSEKSELIKGLKDLEIELSDSEIDKPPSLSHLTKKIGVSLSKSCETMVKNNFTTNCPSYKHLVQLDSSDTDISGKFTTDEDGYFHRGDEPVVDSFKFYWNDEKIRIFVDPPSSMIDRIKMIYIQPNFDTYTLAGDMTVHDKYELVISNKTETLGNLTRVVTFDVRNQTESFSTVLYHDRYIEKCREATVNANEWKKYLPDTIHLMRNDCDRGFTAFEEREVIFPEYSTIDITTSPNWIYQQWLKHTEDFCIFKYKAC